MSDWVENKCESVQTNWESLIRKNFESNCVRVMYVKIVIPISNSVFCSPLGQRSAIFQIMQMIKWKERIIKYEKIPAERGANNLRSKVIYDRRINGYCVIEWMMGKEENRWVK